MPRYQQFWLSPGLAKYVGFQFSSSSTEQHFRCSFAVLLVVDLGSPSSKKITQNSSIISNLAPEFLDSHHQIICLKFEDLRSDLQEMRFQMNGS